MRKKNVLERKKGGERKKEERAVVGEITSKRAIIRGKCSVWRPVQGAGVQIWALMTPTSLVTIRKNFPVYLAFRVPPDDI